MGSEYPRKGERRHTAVPIRHFTGIRTQRKSFSSSARVSGAAQPTTVTVSRVPKSALTPNTRLRKFQKVRDRNLRKHVLDRNNLRRQLNMLEAVGAGSTAGGGGGETTSHGGTTPPPDSVRSLKRVAEEHGVNGAVSAEEETEGNNVELNGQTNGIQTNGEVEEEEEAYGEHHHSLQQVDEEIEVVEQEEEHLIEEQLWQRQDDPCSSEDKELEVQVKVIESAASSSSSRRSTPRRSVTLPEQPHTIMEPEMMSSQNFTIDDTWRSDSLRISGRRPIRGITPQMKRKSDDYSNEPASKRRAFSPSLPSPGWKFLSPFSLFSRRTPGPASTRPDDSMFVNVSTDSEPDIDLNDTPTNDPDPDPSTKPPSWLCNIM